MRRGHRVINQSKPEGKELSSPRKTEKRAKSCAFVNLPSRALEVMLLIRILVVVLPIVLAEADGGRGVRGNVFGSLTGELGRKATQWFRGETMKKNEKLVAKSCDFGDPSKLAFCPPVANPFRLKDEQVKRVTVAVSDCVDHPHNPGCFDKKHLPASSPVSLIAEFPVGSIPTPAPSKNDCYGSMAGDPRYCPSEMPSISNEPSELPTSIPFLNDKGKGVNTDVPTVHPSKKTSIPDTQPAVPPPNILLHSVTPSNIPHSARSAAPVEKPSPTREEKPSTSSNETSQQPSINSEKPVNTTRPTLPSKRDFKPASLSTREPTDEPTPVRFMPSLVPLQLAPTDRPVIDEMPTPVSHSVPTEMPSIGD